MYKNKKELQMQKDIDAFCSKFYKDYNIYPKITYVKNKKIIPKSLKSIETAANNSLKSYNLEYTLSTRNRSKILISHKHIAFKIARDMGYTLKEIGKYFSNNKHCTVLYGANKINNFLDIKDAETVKILNSITEELNK